jgi:hypothetical protein
MESVAKVGGRRSVAGSLHTPSLLARGGTSVSDRTTGDAGENCGSFAQDALGMFKMRWGKRAKGLEPSTFSLEGTRPRTEGTQPQELMSDPTNACTNACTNKPEIEHGGRAEAGPATVASAVSVGDADGAGEHFAKAIAAVMTLPGLTDAERAAAVRRLMGGNE